MDIKGLDYADFAEIRQVITDHRYNLFLDLTKDSIRPIRKLDAIREKMYKDMQRQDAIGRCNRILRAIQNGEQALQEQLCLEKEE